MILTVLYDVWFERVLYDKVWLWERCVWRMILTEVCVMYAFGRVLYDVWFLQSSVWCMILTKLYMMYNFDSSGWCMILTDLFMILYKSPFLIRRLYFNWTVCNDLNRSYISLIGKIIERGRFTYDAFIIGNELSVDLLIVSSVYGKLYTVIECS